MKSRTSVFSLMLYFIVMIFILSSCGNNASVSNKGTAIISSSDFSTDDSWPKTLVDLKQIDVINLNSVKNEKTILLLPKGWTASEFINQLAPDFKFNDPKNKDINTSYSFDLYNDSNTKVGTFDLLSFYRNQPKITIFPNHTSSNELKYSGSTKLGDGEIYLLVRDLPDTERTKEQTTYKSIYAWIPVKNEQLAYNMSIDIPLQSSIDEYLNFAKNILSAK